MRGLARFARDQLGLDLYPGQVEVLDAWAASGKRKAVLCLGRRSGKGIMSATAAIFNAVVPDYSHYLRAGETRFVLIVATKEAQAREHIRVIRELLVNAPDPDLRALLDVNGSSADEVVFRNGVVIRSMPCSSRSVRGLAASLVVFDEFAHFLTDTEGYQAARTVWRALTPSVAQFRDRGYVMVTSTPLWPTGPFYDLYQQGETGVDPSLFTIRRPTWDVNASITRADLEGEFLADPEGAATEYAAEFGTGLGAFLDPINIHASVVRGRRELPPVEGVEYVGVTDPAFAAGGDAFTFAIGHRQGWGEAATYTLDVLRTWRGKQSPLSSDDVLDEIAELARSYRLTEILSDQYAVVPLADGMRRRQIALRGQPLTNELKADIFTALKRGLNTGRVELLDHPQLVAELTYLEIRPTPSGKPRIAAAGTRHDDHAMAVATVVHQLAAGGQAKKLYGSTGAAADDWSALYDRIAEERAAREPPVITARNFMPPRNEAA